MKNIFILTNDMNGGGAEKILLTLLKGLSRDKYQITLALVYKRGPHLDDIPPDITVRCLFEPDQAHTTQIICNDQGDLYHQIAPDHADLEIAFLEGNATKILSKSTNQKAPKIAWVHIDLYNYHYTQYLYKNLEEEQDCYSHFDHLVFVSRGTKHYFEKLFGTAFSGISSVLYNPLDIQEIQQLSLEFPVHKKQLTVCASGRLVPQKGYDRLFSVVKHLQEQGIQFDLWILGDGPDQKHILEQIKLLSRPDSVLMLGFQTNPYPYMLAADIFVCSSYVEGFSTVINEALILDKLVVATDCCGNTEVLQGGKYGFLVSNDEQGLYQGLLKAITDITISERGKNKYLNEIQEETENRLAKIEALWDSLINEYNL